MNFRELYKLGIKELNNKSDIFIIIDNIFNLNRTQLIINFNKNVENSKLNTFFNYIERIKNGEPVQYVVGETQFMGIKFKVGPGVFIPRPETELLVQCVIEKCKKINKETLNIVDLCSGSGCIAISLKKNLTNSNIWAIEKSKSAFNYLIENVKENNISINCINGDIFEEVKNFEDKKFDFIVSNPPYIPRAEIESLDKNVKFEPILSLDGGEKGLDFYRKIIYKWKSKMGVGGSVGFELGMNQQLPVCEFLRENEIKNPETFKDLAGIDRVLIAERLE